MAQPKEMFRGRAPAAMAKMGDGIADAYAKAGAIEGQGLQQFGQAIGGALQSAAGAYAGYKQQQSQVKAQEKALDTFMPYLPKETQATLAAQREMIKGESLSDQAAYYNQTMSMAGNLMGQHFQMQKVGAEQGGATGRTIIAENAASARNAANNETSLENARMHGLLQLYGNQGLINAQKGAAFQPQPFGIGTQLGGGVYMK